jgi:predicted SAM-dependent methyltransferase
MEKLVKKIVPRKYHKILKKPYSILWAMLYRGNQFICPCCNGKFRKFMPYGTITRANAMCPRCYSLERHRLLMLYLKNKTNIFRENLRVLHFAPEDAFQNVFKTCPNIDYVSADLFEQNAMLKMDITSNAFKNEVFDVILCSHVLELVEDDKRAISEMFRVLKKGGWAVIQSPVDNSRERTYEDRSIRTPKEREKHFDEWNHVRIYGLDYKQRLEDVGFTVTFIDYLKELDEDVRKTCALSGSGEIKLCTKK